MAVPAHRDPPRPTWPTVRELREALSGVEGIRARFPGRMEKMLTDLTNLCRAGIAEQSIDGLRARLMHALDLATDASDDDIVAAATAARDAACDQPPRSNRPAGGEPIVVPGEVVRERPARPPYNEITDLDAPDDAPGLAELGSVFVEAAPEHGAATDVERAAETARRLGPELESARRGSLTAAPEVMAGALAVTEIDGSDVVSGSFPPRGTTVLENDWGAWMVHLPTGRGVAHACHRNLLRNRVACLAELRRLLDLPPIPASYRAEAR